jgi:hypothetical protein
MHFIWKIYSFIFCGKIWPSNLGALFAISCKLLELKMWRRHVCEVFCTMIIDYVDHGKNIKFVV